MQYRMLYAADVHIYRQIFVCFFLGYQLFIVVVDPHNAGNTRKNLPTEAWCWSLVFAGAPQHGQVRVYPLSQWLPEVILRYLSAR